MIIFLLLSYFSNYFFISSIFFLKLTSKGMKCMQDIRSLKLHKIAENKIVKKIFNHQMFCEDELIKLSRLFQHPLIVAQLFNYAVVSSYRYASTHSYAHLHVTPSSPSSLPPKIHSLTGDDDITSSCTLASNQCWATAKFAICEITALTWDVLLKYSMKYSYIELSFLFLLQSFFFSRRG